MKTFEKQLDIRNTVEYVYGKAKTIIIVAIVSFIAILLFFWAAQRERIGKTDVYTCVERVLIIPEDGSHYTANTCGEILISQEAIEAALKDLGMKQGYYGVLGIMKWEWGDSHYAYKMSITSNMKEIEGQPLDVILGMVIENGMQIAEDEIEISQMAIIDEPYYEITTKEDITFISLVNSSLQYTALMVLFVVVVLCCMCSANGRIGSIKDIEKNFNVPVLGVRKKNELEGVNELKGVPAVCVADILKSVCADDLQKFGTACVLLFEKEKTSGREALRALEELSEAGITVKGAILVE